MKATFAFPLALVLWVFVGWFSPTWAWKRPKHSPVQLKQAGVLHVGRQPKQIVVSPDHSKAYVTNFGGKSISVIDLRRFQVIKTLQTGGAPVEGAFTPDGRFVFITNFDKVTPDGPEAGLWKIDTRTDTVVAHIPGHRYPKGVVVSPDGKLVYFSSWWWPRGYLVAVDVHTNKVVQKARVWNRPRGMAMSPDGKILYLCNFGEFQKKSGDLSHREGAGLAWIDPHTLKPLRKLVYGGYLTRHVTASLDGRWVYASHLGSSVLVEFHAKTGKIRRTTRAAIGPKTIDLTSDGRFLLVANYFGRSLSVIDTQTFKEVERVRVPDRLSGLDVSSDDKYVYVSGWDTRRIWRFQIIRTP